ncbi:patatin-like phospholipase family protein [Mesorhizobium sp. M1E.F.Ca.ET.063.01.1.1]|uniref:patatin-like phospholipase family protein n=1 Tax=Mesorhizobium sp. M1E.F.Ca.ET.063.01.1.1 TaxID=2496750 RepID=UPI000FCBF35C|nr:patatin-like phospholipase family protein [Mesorhizobium sp. M1E.F.Ca.ET.063.01.1.1]RUW86130.1 patatin family protein [Mesorhizobium sp. M1E.F.Ca.ET.063.01.1.1]
MAMRFFKQSMVLHRTPGTMPTPGLRENLLKILLLALCTSQLTGCIAAYPRDGVPAQYVSKAEVSGYPGDIRVWGDSYASFPADRLVRLRDQRKIAAKTDASIKLRELNALTLSGGGSSGAFGAGILAGWTKAGTRPQFDIVTGISTGALIAPFAFLGPAYDDELKQSFTKISDSDIYIKHSLLGLVSSSSFTSNAPLARMLDQHITYTMLDQIVRESAKGRRLFIGTTNLDADRAVIWDMGAIAASGRPDRLKLFKQVMLASTAIPGIFPPVQLEVTAAGRTYHEMHVDGGTSNEVFLMPAGLRLSELDRTFHTQMKARLYIIRNGRTMPEPSIVKATLPDIAGKAVSSLIKTQAIGDLYRLYATAKRDGIDYNVIDIPADFTVEAKSPFDNKYMRALYEKGYEIGHAGVPWKKTPPGFSN